MLVAQGMSGLEALPDTLAGDARTLDLATATLRVESWTMAARARAIAQLYARTLAEHQQARTARASHRYDDQAFTRAEIAANLSLDMGISLSAADAEVRIALTLARHPDLAVALATGRLHPAQARVVVKEVATLTEPWVRARVVAGLVGDPGVPEERRRLVRELRRPGIRLWQLPTGRLAAIIRREAALLDPSSVEERARRSVVRRHVRYYGGPDNTAELVMHGPADQLAAALSRLDRTAVAARRAGVEGTLDHLRFDIAVAGLTGGLFGLTVTLPHRPRPPSQQPTEATGPGARAIVADPAGRAAVLVNVTVPAATLAGGDEPGVLHGPDGDTPLPAGLARELAYDPDHAIWRQVRCDPITGQATGISRRYRPSRRLAEHVYYRDGMQSRFPTSTTRRRVELDHIEEFDHDDPAAGGQTTPANVATEGLREHHLKTDHGFFVSGDADGCLTYRTRLGRTYYSWPHQHMRPVDPPDEPGREVGPASPSARCSPPPDYGDPPF